MGGVMLDTALSLEHGVPVQERHSLSGYKQPRPALHGLLNEFLTNWPGLTALDVRGDSRLKAISQPRQAFMAYAYATEQYSLPEIGRFLGGRDHTTILHGVRVHRARGEL